MILKTLSVAVLTTLVSAVAYAQASAYPTRPIRLIVPFAPGGAADQTARLISEPMAKQLGQPLIVENKPGGGATIGAALVASAAPDSKPNKLIAAATASSKKLLAPINADGQAT